MSCGVYLCRRAAAVIKDYTVMPNRTESRHLCSALSSRERMMRFSDKAQADQQSEDEDQSQSLES